MKKNYLHLLAIMMVAMLSVAFISCGDDNDDDPTPPVTNPEKTDSVANPGKKDSVQNSVNADLIGWWKEPANDHGYVAIGNAYTFIRHALHFINSNTVEEVWVGSDSDVENAHFPYGSDCWKRAFDGWLYFTSFEYYTWVYKREENVIRLEGSNLPIVIVDNKLRWGSVEYEKVNSK